jgi:amino acid adenylation domain-containing protein
VAACASRAGTTPFTVLLAAFGSLVARYTGQDRFAVGVPVAGRFDPRSDQLIGLFVNSLAMPADVRGDPTFSELVARTAETMLSALEHQEVPFDKVLERLDRQRVTGFNPVYQVMLAFNDTPSTRGHAGITLEPLDLDPGYAKLDLTLNVAKVDDVLRCDLYYAVDLFDEQRMLRFAEHFRNLVAGHTSDPHRPVSAVEVRSSHERALLASWNATDRAYAGTSLPVILWQRAATGPDLPAVWAEDRWRTYAELRTDVAALAGTLRAAGVGPDEVVGVCLPRGHLMVTALHAVQAAGGAYLPLPTDLRPKGIAVLLAELGVRIVLTDASTTHLVPEELTIRTGPDGSPPITDPVPVSPDNLAYVIHTSGSTGRPKAIGVSHRAIVNRLRWMQDTFATGSNDRLVQKTPYGFDVSVWEFFWPLLSGAGLVVAAPDGHRDPTYLLGLMRDQDVSVVHFVPSMLDAFLDEPGLGRLTGLRRVICSGEALPPALVARFQDVLPAVELHNLYGPTEAAVDVSWHACDRSDARAVTVPIGAPVANTRLTVRDERLRATPVGVPGELCISGVQLARGYLGAPGMTADRFVPDPDGPAGQRLYRTGDLARWRADGELEFLGRVDNQVKLNGRRIEPGEVEALFETSPWVRSAAVVVTSDGSAPRLVAYVVLNDRGDDHLNVCIRLRELARDELPSHLVPSAILPLDELPLTRSGKLDRTALAALPLPTTEPTGQVPVTEAEQAVATALRDILGLAAVGMGDNFFTVGGDSIRGLKLIARLRDAGWQLALPDLFRGAAVRDLADALRPTTPDAVRPESSPFSLLDPADLATLNRIKELPNR